MRPSLHQFNVAAARAEVARSALPRIHGPRVWMSNGRLNPVRAVPDRERFDLGVNIGYVDSVEEDLKERIEDLGGFIDAEHAGGPGGVPGLHAVVSDGGVAQLRAEFGSSLVFTQHDQIGCSAAESPPRQVVTSSRSAPRSERAGPGS